ncbi:hypothetical protein GCM10009839_08740 [Catenulispora yoronensis]|uniref:DUF3618 domain-containing protein n=1 Tax=Catenulispora yoronensis TaxID=450799 RepID=A0ABP5F428_9ACTN
MNQSINDGVHAVRAAGQRVLDRVETAAGEVRHEAAEAGDRLVHATKKSKKRDRARGRKRAAGIVASTTSVLAFLGALVMRRKNKKAA